MNIIAGVMILIASLIHAWFAINAKATPGTASRTYYSYGKHLLLFTILLLISGLIFFWSSAGILAALVAAGIYFFVLPLVAVPILEKTRTNITNVILQTAENKATIPFQKNVSNPDSSLAEITVRTQVSAFNSLKARWPERDMNYWLAQTLINRPGWPTKPEWVYLSETGMYSVLDTDTAPIALGLYVLYKEHPYVAAHYGDQFEMMMRPIYKMMEDGTFIDKWKKTNPWTIQNYPIVLAGLEKTIADKKAHS